MIGRFFNIGGLFVAWCVSACGQTSPIDLGIVEAEGGRKVYRLDFGRTQASLSKYAAAAFRMHGAFRQVPAMQGDFSFEFRSASDGAVELEVFTGKPRRSRLRKVLRGADTTQALLRACDEAVLATIGTPGFFAGKLVYVSKRGKSKEVCVADPLFLRASPKTNYKCVSVNPSWSANGRGIFFTSNKRFFNDVYFMDLVARSVKPVADYKGSNLRGVQSPAGGKIAYVLSVTGNPELWIADGIGARPRRITSNSSNESGPCWHPNGNRLIVTSDSTSKPQLYEISLSSGRLTRIPTNVSRHCSEATWNPRNPDRIAFTAAVGGGFQLAEYDFTLRRSRLLTTGPADCLQPEWANDGRHVFFTERRGGKTRLMILDAGSDEEARLTTRLEVLGGSGVAGPRQSSLPIAKPVSLHDERFGNCSQPRFFYGL